MTETTKTIEERVAALETKTTTLSTDVSNATTVANRAAGSATTANSTANTAKANAGTAQAAADTAAAAAAAARTIAEAAALTAEDSFGETQDNLTVIESFIRPTLKKLQNKDAALQTAIDAIPDVSAEITALKAADVTLQENIDAIPDVSAEITALKAADVTLQENIDAIPTVPAEIIPLAVGESVEITGVGEDDYYLFRNIVPGTYRVALTLNAFDKTELGIPSNFNVRSRIEIEDKNDKGSDSGNKIGLFFSGISSDGSESKETVSVDFNVFDGDKLYFPAKTIDSLPQRTSGYIQVRPWFTFSPIGGGSHIYEEHQDKLTWRLNLSRLK